MSHKKVEWFGIAAFLLFLFSFPALAFADWEDILRKFRPHLEVQEQYTDNLFLTNANTVDDFLTTILPGVTFSSTENKEVKYGLDLDYTPGFVFYAHNSQLNYVSHQGTLNTWYTFGRNVTFRVWDNFIHSQEPREEYVTVQSQPGEYYLGVQHQRSTYTRNILEPSLTYQFGREDRFELTFQDNAYYNQASNIEDSRLDALTPRLTYWFDIHNGIILEYKAVNGSYETSPDFIGQRARARYTYRFDPHTSIFGDYTFDTFNYEYPGVNYNVQQPSIGITHAFSRTLSGRAQAGYFWQQPQTGSSNSGFSLDIGITQRMKRTTYDLSARGGYTYDLSSAENLGFTKYYQGIGNITHQLASRVSVGILGSVGRYEYTQQQDQIDWIWRVQGNLSYQLLRWLTASFSIYHQEDNSSVDTSSYKENSAIIRIRATYW
jgi:hypothetical protein